MRNLNSCTRFLLLFIVLFVFAGGCSKSDINDRPDPQFDTIAELDITGEAMLSVSKDNPDGADGLEGSMKLIDGDTTTKFLIKDFQSVNIDFKFDSVKLVASYQFTTGNDADGRDPLDWKFYGSDDGKQWVELDSRMGMQFRKRRTNYRFYFENTTPYKYYRWSVLKVYGGDMFQASEFRLIQMPPASQKTEPLSRVDSVMRNDLKLIFVNHSDKEALNYKEKLSNAFFTVYPELLKEYNPNAVKRVYFIVDPTYDGVAYSFGDVVVFSYKYMEGNPNDGDVAVHEIMHKIQAAYQGSVPGWLTEGIADYVRDRFGIDDPDRWSLPDYASDQNYDGSYGITGRYLKWIEKHKRKDFVRELNDALIEGVNYRNFWVQKLGSSMETVWDEYAKNPAL